MIQTPDPSQAWFCTRRWQRREREADEAYADGRFRTFNNVDDFLAGLDAYADVQKRNRTTRRRA